ncbi:MAG: hypothetical protein EOP88_15695 [Verrucomicrobiaceae bacterium]|nr:MAG: hypothetical protein EOP88_15695 [Verrucomicrobiaceae bacterium]
MARMFSVSSLADRECSTRMRRSSSDSGAWGLFVSAVQGAANLLGEGTALESLKQGEELGRQDYETVLQDPGVQEEFRALIRNELLPPVMKHIASLEAREQAA